MKDQICLTIGQIQVPSSPSTKELHGNLDHLKFHFFGQPPVEHFPPEPTLHTHVLGTQTTDNLIVVKLPE